MPRCLTLLLRLCGCAPRIDDELVDQQKQAQRNSVPKEHDYDVGTPFEPPRRGGYVEYSKRQQRKTRSMTSNFGSTSCPARREHYGRSQSTLKSGSTVTVGQRSLRRRSARRQMRTPSIVDYFTPRPVVYDSP